jgi:hypothetical protein
MTLYQQIIETLLPNASPRELDILMNRSRSVLGVGCNNSLLCEIAPRHNVSKTAIMNGERKLVRILSNRLTHLAEKAKDDRLMIRYVEKTPEMENLPEKIYDISKLIELSVRTGNCLKNADLLDIRKLQPLRGGELLKIPNFGRKSLKELHVGMREVGYPFDWKI